MLTDSRPPATGLDAGQLPQPARVLRLTAGDGWSPAGGDAAAWPPCKRRENGGAVSE